VSNVIEIIPLGGIGEFGMNCTLLRYGDEMLVLDAGMGFPEESVYGVDVCIPDFEILEQYRNEITAIILTHGHEDHLGALPYVLKKINVPVYASHFTLGLAESKLDEHGLLGDVLLHRVEPRDVITIGSFTIEFIRASHSLVDCFHLAIKTPVGTIIHTGDYKVDETPVIGEPIDLRTLRRYGQEGVLALLSDSTNATVPGRTPSERAVIPAFEEIFAEAPGRIIVAAFASSIHRLQIVFDVAQQFGRKVCVLGRSMQKNVEIAERLGYLDIHGRMLVSINDAKSLADDEIVFLVTGSQAEPRAALYQLATQIYKGLTIEEGDTVVLSARIIPGNERAISKLIGHIYKRGANIIEEKRRLIHVSGHASQDDIRIMTEAVRPKFVVPIHGEYRMLFRHKGVREESPRLRGREYCVDRKRRRTRTRRRARDDCRQERNQADLHRRVGLRRDRVRNGARAQEDGLRRDDHACRDRGSRNRRAAITAADRRARRARAGRRKRNDEGRATRRCGGAGRSIETNFRRRITLERACAGRTQAVHSEGNGRQARHRPSDSTDIVSGFALSIVGSVRSRIFIVLVRRKTFSA
jgi:ribonuclease J